MLFVGLRRGLVVRDDVVVVVCAAAGRRGVSYVFGVSHRCRRRLLLGFLVLRVRRKETRTRNKLSCSPLRYYRDVRNEMSRTAFKG